MIKVAIHGFGRIGRTILRAGINDKQIKFVAINDLADQKTLIHLLKRDSVHGAFPYPIKEQKDGMTIKNQKIKILSETNTAKLPWKKLGVDIVIECTGKLLTRTQLNQHLKAGAKKVLLSAPAKSEVDYTIVKGVNEKNLKKTHKIVSNGSCTTNALAPLLKVLQDNFVIKKGFMTTTHAYTNDQNVLDSPHSDLRRARSAATNAIPTSTGAAKTIHKIIPELKGKIDGTAIRVPIPLGSIIDLVCEVEKKTTTQQVNKAFEKLSKTKLKGILEYSEEPLVSTDIIGNTKSTILDSTLTKVVQGNLIQLFSWYDNETGFSNRMIEVLKLMK